LCGYRHALRSSELVSLRWDDVDFTTGRLHVRRAKGGETAVHPISGKELRALRRLQRESERSTYIFVSERGAPLSVAGYQRMVARAGVAAGFPFLIHSHMLRHSCGYKLANDGHDTSRGLLQVSPAEPPCAVALDAKEPVKCGDILGFHRNVVVKERCVMVHLDRGFHSLCLGVDGVQLVCCA
jgi:hypothetical protein